jgi:uncharacterized membrane protein YgcG
MSEASTQVYADYLDYIGYKNHPLTLQMLACETLGDFWWVLAHEHTSSGAWEPCGCHRAAPHACCILRRRRRASEAVLAELAARPVESGRLCTNLLARISVRLATKQPRWAQGQGHQGQRQRQWAPGLAEVPGGGGSSSGGGGSSSSSSSSGRGGGYQELIAFILPELQPRLPLLVPHMLALAMWALAKAELLQASCCRCRCGTMPLHFAAAEWFRRMVL